ncbi:SEC-C metal-binding domain-containing protein [Bradyrhizobium sp. sGM-13]|uniref:SEC-C metal-binding domain-containing protein n=1 Tax=Bradyrhizobium sp. sGM-13 TaxID=2831781 RepID=UPI0035C82D79
MIATPFALIIDRLIDGFIRVALFGATTFHAIQPRLHRGCAGIAGLGARAEDDVFEGDDEKSSWVDFVHPNEPVRNPWRHVGRNDPCPCGSGKKAKKCCLANGEPPA